MKEKNHCWYMIAMIMVVALNVTFISCGDDDSPDAVLEVSPKNLQLGKSGEGTFMIKSNTKWEISAMDSWLTFSTLSGVGDEEVQVWARGSSTKDRTTTVTIKGENISHRIMITQVAPKKYYLYGDVANHPEQTPFKPGAWDASVMRFSDTEGVHFPTIPDHVYNGLKTLIFDVSDVTPDFDLKVMNGWWSNTYYDHVKWVDGLNELQITQAMAEECSKGGEGRDLSLMLYSGSCTINTVYYWE